MAETEKEDRVSRKIFKIPKRDSDGGWAWLVLIGATLWNFVIGAFTTCVGIWYLKMLEQFGSGASETSMVYAVNSITFSVAAVLSGYLSDHYAMSTPMLAASCVATVATVCAGHVPNLLLVTLTLGAINGTCRGIIYSPTLSAIPRYFIKKRLLASTVFVSGASFGILIINPLLQIVIREYSLVGAMYALACLMLQGCVTAMTLRPMVPEEKTLHLEQNTLQTDQQAADRDVQLSFRILRELAFLKNAMLLRVWGSIAFCAMGYLNFFVFLPAYGQEMSLSEGQISGAFIIMAVAEITCRPVISAAITKFNIDERLSLILCCLTAFVTCVGLAYASNPWGVVVLCGLLGGSGSFFFAVMIPLVASVVKTKDLGRALGGLPLAFSVGPALGSPVFGAIGDASGSFQIVQLCLGLCFVVAILPLAWNFGLDTRRRHRNDAATEETCRC